MVRWRLAFSRREELKFLSHQELMRLWERGLCRAGLPLAYSQGFSPHPRLCLALPLPVGATGEGELMELWLRYPLYLPPLLPALSQKLPGGVGVGVAETIPQEAPSLPSLVVGAEYLVWGEGVGAAAAVAAFLASSTFPWHHSSPKGERAYDLRPLVEALWPLEGGVGMRLHPSARAQQVALALGLLPRSIHRTRLLLREG